MLDSIQGFNLELTNICTLKCPRCARTQFLEKFGTKNWKNKQLDLDNLKKFIDIDVKGKLFTLCGNYGDPIYYNNLFPLVEWIKAQGARLCLVTNGSYKTQAWWNDFVSLLDSNDEVVFSIDGVPENFTEYRINADWPSIEVGIRIASSAVKTYWKYIPFSFNQGTIEQARKLSQSLGVHEFLVTPSSRWEGENDPLRPADNTVFWARKAPVQAVDPVCKKTHAEHFISADGQYAPCCQVSDYRYYYKSEFYKNASKYNISNTTITKILSETQDFYNELEKSKHNYCLHECPKYD